MLEPYYNSALWAYKTAEYQDAYSYIQKALKIYPQHEESKILLKNIEEILKVI